MGIDPRKPEEAVAILRGEKPNPGGAEKIYTGTADAMVKALLESSVKLPLKLNEAEDRYENLDKVMDSKACHDILDKFRPSFYQASWAVKVAHQLRPYWFAAQTQETER